MHLHPGKLRTRWTGPFIIAQIFEHGAIEVYNPNDHSIFKVNEQRLKPYFEIEVKDVEVVYMADPVYTKD